MSLNSQIKIFSFLFISTGIFAIIGALYTWGEGILFEQTDLATVLIPYGDLIIAGPLSLLAGFALWRKNRWGVPLGTMCCGIYIFGGVLVYILLLWSGPPFPAELVIPPIFGYAISVWFVVWIIKNRINSFNYG